MQIAPEVTSVLVNVGIPAILGLEVWMVRKIASFEVKFTRLDTWAVGLNGNNGANGRIGALEQAVDDIKDSLPDRPERRHRARRAGDPQ